MSRLPVSGCRPAPRPTRRPHRSSARCAACNRTAPRPSGEPAECGSAADGDGLLDLRRLDARVGQRLPARREGAFDDRRVSASSSRVKVFRSTRVSSRSEDRSLAGSPPCGFLAASKSGEPDTTEPAVAAISADGQSGGCRCRRRRVGVAVGGEHLEDAVLDAEDRDVRRAAAEVVDRNQPAYRFVSRRPARPRSAR
jgi:hypothetical protein